MKRMAATLALVLLLVIAFLLHREPRREAPRKPTPLPPLTLDQAGCVYDPHVLGIQVDQPLDIHNNDSLLHNVHAVAFGNREFNFGMTSAGIVETVKFNAPEVMVKIKCDIHPWMTAWVGVLDH